ncbi:MAG: cysteine desulfurase NifS [Lachnospiraceae bacterium]|nr:cysteine desulfurase NifS [Lachnospiraceae bacterium]
MIYLDNAATTKPKKKVIDVMMPFLTEQYGNPSAIYSFSAQNKTAIQKARKQVAELINAKENSIYFTSGGTEADNWALIKTAEAYEEKGRHIITTKIEHHAILHTCDYLEKRGFEITYLGVDNDGRISLEELKQAIRKDTILISVMFANNEVGTIQPIEQIGEIASEHGIVFHTDAVQAFGHVPIDVEAMHIDLLSASGHKIYGPKGVGCLYINNSLKISSLIHGGGQERARRAGTENVPGIVGFGHAAMLAKETLKERMEKETRLRDFFIKELFNRISDIKLNGCKENRLPNNINVSFPYVEGESMLIMLDMQEICASSGSACTAGSIDPSHVLVAMGLSSDEARESVRFTISDETTEEELRATVDAVETIVSRLRSMSPYYDN